MENFKTSEQELDSLFLKMKKYSDLIGDASKYKMDIYNERWKLSKEELISKCDEIIPELDDLVEKLQREVKGLSIKEMLISRENIFLILSSL